MRKKIQEEIKGTPSWMTTFLDVMMLLLTFFILLMSMVTFEKTKLEQAAGSLKESFGILKRSSKTDVQKESVFKTAEIVEEIQSTKKRLSGLINYIQSVNLDNFISVIQTDKGISIRIADSILFGQAETDIVTSAYSVLDRIASIAKDAPYNILIEGHTDDLPIKSLKFPSNWELSAARAASVVRYFIGKGVKPNKLAALGYAMYQPLVPNITPVNRSKNRRVEIKFISPEFMESKNRDL